MGARQQERYKAEMLGLGGQRLVSGKGANLMAHWEDVGIPRAGCMLRSKLPKKGHLEHQRHGLSRVPSSRVPRTVSGTATWGGTARCYS